MPPPDWEIKLCDVPEMNYFASNNVGEIVVKGPGVFKVVLIDLCSVIRTTFIVAVKKLPQNIARAL